MWVSGRTHNFFQKMKKKNILWLIAFALLMPLFALTACSDDDDDDNNDSTGDKTEQTSNDGTKVLSKKVTKIVYTIEKYKNYEESWSFDDEGRELSYKIVDGDTKITTYTHSKDKIEYVRVTQRGAGGTHAYHLENGRVVDYDGDGKFTYSDGYLASYYSVEDDGDKYEFKYTVENGNLTKIEEFEEYYADGEIGVEEKSKSISYGSKLNNLNVDLTALLLDEWGELGNYFGKRSKNLPSVYTKIKKGTYTYNGETTEHNSSEVKNFEYIYEGDYPVKILVNKVEDGRESPRTYEIFYE